MPDSPEKQAKDAATYIAVTVMAVMGIGILLFCALVLPVNFQILFLMMFGFAFTIYLQYIIWGRKLSQSCIKEEENDEDNN